MRKSPYLRFVLMVMAFLGFTGLGISVAMRRSEVSLGHLTAAFALSPGWLCAVAAAAVGIYVTDYFRYLATCRVLGLRLPFWAGCDAVVANFFFSWISPASVLGLPAATYMLGRGGVPWDAAPLVAYGKSIGGIAVLLVVAGMVLALGAGPAPSPALQLVLAGGGATMALLVLLPLLAVFWPAPCERLVAAAARHLCPRLASRPGLQSIVDAVARAVLASIARAARLRQASWLSLLLVLVAHLAYLTCFVAALALLAAAHGATPVARNLGVSVVYVATLMVAPTPSGAGISELAACPFFDGLLPPTTALLVVLVFRTVTFYLHLAVGAVYLTVVGGLRDILLRRRQVGGGTIGR
jgi:uncharacterized membrane protein YbhN (UPF0104 family)